MNRVTGIQIIILAVVSDYYRQNGRTAKSSDEQVQSIKPITQRVLLHPGDPHEGLVNEWIEKNGIPEIYASRLTSSNTLVKAIELWRELGMMERDARFAYASTNRRRYITTRKGDAFVRKLGPNWTTWPVSIPIFGRDLLLEKAEYLGQFLSEKEIDLVRTYERNGSIAGE